MRPKKRRAEKVMHTRKGWRHADDVKRLRIIMATVAVAAVVFVVTGSVVIWMILQGPLQSNEGNHTASTTQALDITMPVYDDAFNLVLVNKSRPLKDDFAIKLVDFEGVQIEERIKPALEKMMEDAKKAGCELKLNGGYVDKDTQQGKYQAEVERLMSSGNYTKIRAEEDAKMTAPPGGYSELQTGMAVQFMSVENPNADFGTTKEYRWLEKNSVYYGFILRYPSSKADTTGHTASSTQFRYVGTEHATKMRSLGMCLEEYYTYVRSR